MSPDVIGVIALVGSLILYCIDIFPMWVTGFISVAIMGLTGACSLASMQAGFSNHILFMTIGLLVVGQALVQTRAAEWVGQRLSKYMGKSPKIFLASCILITAAISSILNNAATTITMLPIAGAVVAGSKGKLEKKWVYMPIGFAAVAGGGLTLIGTTSQVVVNGLLESYGLEPTAMFDWTLTGVTKVAILLIFFLTFGGALMRKVCDFPEVPDADVTVEELKFNWKIGIALGTLVACVAGFMAGIWNYGTIAMVGAVIVVITRCVDKKTLLVKLDWNVILLVGFVLSFGTCIKESGAGALIVDFLVGLVGTDVNPFIILAIIAVVGAAMGNLITATATVTVLAPICVYLAEAVSMDPRTLIIASAIFATCNFTTPTSTPPNTYPLVAGYRYMDYIKLGGFYNVLAVAACYAVVVLTMPLR